MNSHVFLACFEIQTYELDFLTEKKIYAYLA